MCSYSIKVVFLRKVSLKQKDYGRFRKNDTGDCGWTD